MDPATVAALADELEINKAGLTKKLTLEQLITLTSAILPTHRTGILISGALGTYYTLGHYDFATDDANLTQASTTQAHGTANEPHASHVAIVAGGAGTASGGAGAVEIEVSGTSIDETGTRTPGDTEILVADITAMSLNEYFETSKKWLGTVIITLQNAGGSTQTTFAADFNYGHCKYTDMTDRDFEVNSFTVDGRAGNNDTGFDIRLLKHSASGWTYAATGFVPGNGEICSLATDYSTESDLSQNEQFAYDRSDLATVINGAGSEGFIVEVVTAANNAVAYMNATVGVKFI